MISPIQYYGAKQNKKRYYDTPIELCKFHFPKTKLSCVCSSLFFSLFIHAASKFFAPEKRQRFPSSTNRNAVATTISVSNCSSFDLFDRKFDHSSYSKNLCKHSQI